MLLALLVSLLAGLATSIGGLMVLNKKTLQRSYLAVALAFAAGAMLIISLFQIVPLGIEYMESTTSDRTALVVVWVSFFAGIALVLTIDRLLPDVLNPNEMEGREDDMSVGDQASTRHLMRSGALVAVVLALHNFPEGMATFFPTYQDPTVGMTLAVAIAIARQARKVPILADAVPASPGSRPRCACDQTAPHSSIVADKPACHAR